MAFVSDQDLYRFMLRGYHVFDERIPADRLRDMNAIIDDMNARDFDPDAYPGVAIERRDGEDGVRIQAVVRNIMELDPTFGDLIDLDYVLPWVVTLLNRPPRLTENYGYFRDANRPADYHAVRDGGQTRNLNHRGSPQIEMVKLVVPLTDQNADTGTLSVIPGSHLLDMQPPFDLDEADALPELRILDLAAGQPAIFTENLYHAGYPGANMTRQRRTLFFSYEPSHHPDWVVSPSDEGVARCTPRQRKLLRRPGRWHEDWSAELQAIGESSPRSW